jgi:cytochrome c oxidase subunit 2
LAQRVVKPKTNLGPGFWPVTALIVVVSAIMVYLVETSPLPIGLVQAGAPADSIDALFRFLGAVAAVIFNVVVIYTVYFGIVFARPKGAPPNTIGVQIHDAPVLEFWWTAIPTILVIILAIYSTKIWADLQNTQGDVLTVEAIGYQFGFQYRYPKLAQPLPELHLPVNTPTTIHITSRDVIHGFWIPELRMKADMVPGLINTIRVTPTVPGTYRVICSEFCGLAHGAMKGTVIVQSQQDFGRWFAQQGGRQTAAGGGSASGTAIAIDQGKADAGQKLFGQKCSACHSTGPFEQKQVGPGLGRLFNDGAHPKLVNGAPVNPQNVAAIVQNGYQGDMGVMPSAQVNQISNPDIANLVAYLVSLSKK